MPACREHNLRCRAVAERVGWELRRLLAQSLCCIMDALQSAQGPLANPSERVHLHCQLRCQAAQ